MALLEASRLQKSFGVGVDKYGLDNAMIDLINNLLGSLIAASLGWAYLKFTRREDRRRLAEPLSAAMAPLLTGDIPDE